MNKPDLKSFKDKKNDVAAMIPGIHNLSSIGSAPILRKAYNPSTTGQYVDADHFDDTQSLKTTREIAQAAVDATRQDPMRNSVREPVSKS